MKLPDRIYKRLVIFNTVALFAIVLAAVLLVSVRRERVAEIVRSWIDRETASSRAIEALSRDETAGSLDYPVFDLQIDSPEMRQIQLQTEQLIDAGVMSDDLVAWFPARFFYEETQYKVKVRLRGDLGAHWEDQKKSWRIKFPKERMFQGRRVLDLIVPHDKAFEVEKVAYDAARKLGLLVPDAGFANLKINGVDFGAYFWIEKYGPEMLEKQGYAVGEIFRNQNLWTQTRFSGFGIKADEFTSSSTNTVHDEAGADPYAARFDKLTTLTRKADDAAFRKEIAHLVHIEKFLKWNALSWMFGSLHSHGPDNLRWYYDNTSGLFEPILYDVYRYSLRLPSDSELEIPRWRFESHENSPIARRILQIPQYRQRRNEILWKLVTEDEYDVARQSNDYFQQLRTLLLRGVGSWDSSEIDKFHEETFRVLSENRNDLREHLAFARLFVTPSAAIQDARAVLQLRLLPDCRNFVSIDRLKLTFPEGAVERIAPEAISLVDLEGQKRRVGEVEVSALEKEALTLSFKDLHVWTPVDQQLVQYPAEWTLEVVLGNVGPEHNSADLVAAIEVEANNSVTGLAIDSDHLINSPIIAGGDPLEPSPVVKDLDEFLSESDLPWRVDGQRLTLPAGNHRISGTITIPSDFGLRLSAGTTLEMEPAANIICYGPLDVRGTAEEPARVVAVDEARPWGALAVIHADDVSHIQHFEISGGSEVHTHGLFLSGQVCCYWSDVEFEGCAFSNARADDACNVKNAALSMKDCVFYDNSGDGLDADFCNGSIESCRFSDNGGDGLDVSGSRLLVRDSLFERMRDKGISVGEKSDLFAFNNVIRNCVIGVASKDLSQTTLYASVLYENETGVALYRKKQLFGGGKAAAIGVLFWNNGRQTDVDDESQFDLRASGADRWESTDAIAEDKLLLGDPGSYYTTDMEMGIIHRDQSDEESPFKVPASTAGVTFVDFTAPDLRGKPFGLVEPLELPTKPAN